MSAQRAIPPSNILAPWAEIIPGAGPVTVDALLTMPDDGWRYEVVEGVLVRAAGSGKRATQIGLRLGGRLIAYVEEHNLGVATGADGVYTFPGAETGLLPDVGFYVAARDALVEDEDKPIPFAPDLAAEVVSPSQDASDMAAKVRIYLRGGTRLAWVLWPARREVDVWRPKDLRPRYQDMRPSTRLRLGDALDGEDVVLGFSYLLADLFR